MDPGLLTLTSKTQGNVMPGQQPVLHPPHVIGGPNPPLQLEHMVPPAHQSFEPQQPPHPMSPQPLQHWRFSNIKYIIGVNAPDTFTTIGPQDTHESNLTYFLAFYIVQIDLACNRSYTTAEIPSHKTSGEILSSRRQPYRAISVGASPRTPCFARKASLSRIVG